MQVRAISTDAPKGGVKTETMDIDTSDFPVILKPVLTGICGTDRGIVNGSLPFAYNPHGYDRLVLGHESLCRVVSVEDNDFGIRTGDLVVPVVRRPGKCINCLAGRSDNCSDGDKHEAGITGMHGFMRDEFGDFPEFLVKVQSPILGDVAVLTEPLKNVCKAFEVFDRISSRSIFTDRSGSYDEKRSVIIGTGSEGFLYALKSKDYGFKTLITNRHPMDELKNRILDRTGIEFYDYTKPGDMEKGGFDLVVDTSGDPSTIFRFMRKLNNNGILILFGTNGRAPESSLSGEDIDHVIERNITIAGSVDGSRIHYERALQDLTRWNSQYGEALSMMITSMVKPEDTSIFMQKPREEIKTVISWS